MAPKYQIIQKNSGPFAMWQVCLTRKSGRLAAGTVLSTHSDKNEAHEAAQRYVAEDRDCAFSY